VGSFATSRSSATTPTLRVVTEVSDPKRIQIERLLNDEMWIGAFMGRFEYQNGPLDTPCLVWTGGTDRSGYGRIHVKKYHENKTGRNFFTHRLAYMAQRGYITSDEMVLHQCHVRLCGNADHHHLGDHDDNMTDLANSGRVAGSNNHNSKLDEDDVWDMLVMYYEENASINEVMEEFDMSKGAVTDILYGRTWSSVYEEFWED